MTIQAALFDVDGIVIIGRKQLFSHALAEKQGIPREVVEEFFLNNFRKCSFGKADLKEEIAPYLTKWNWQGSVDSLLKFWFETESAKDPEVIKIISKLRSKGVKCYVATRQEKYRLKYIWENLGLKEHFDGVFSTCDIGYDKKDPEYFQYIFKELELKPEEFIFFDDSQANVDNAKSLGIRAYHHDNIEVLKEQTKDITG
jgi:putative hydrolase of the HAD superfamily